MLVYGRSCAKVEIKFVPNSTFYEERKGCNVQVLYVYHNLPPLGHVVVTL